MDETTARPLIPAVVIVGGLLLLPVVFLIVGFSLVPLMALTAWSRTAWIATLTVLSVFAIVGAVPMIVRLRSQSRVVTPEGGQMPVMAMIGQIVGSPTVAVGWAYHLFNSAVIGAIFGWLLAGRVHNYSTGLLWGVAYGFVWWILGGLILMPVMLGMPPFAPLMMPPMLMVAMGSLVGHLVYGLILGGVFAWLYRGVPMRAAA